MEPNISEENFVFFCDSQKMVVKKGGFCSYTISMFFFLDWFERLKVDKDDELP